MNRHLSKRSYPIKSLLLGLAIIAFFLTAYFFVKLIYQPTSINQVSTTKLPITGTFFMPDMPDSYVTEANLKPMFDEMKEAGIDTLLGFSMIFDVVDSADPQKHTCSSVIHTRMPYLKMAHQYGMGVYMAPIAYDPNNPGNILSSCAISKIAELKTIMESQYGIPFSLIKGWDFGEAPIHYYYEKGLSNSIAHIESLLANLDNTYPDKISYISPYPLGNEFTYEAMRSAFDQIFDKYPNLDMIIPQDSGGNPARPPAQNAVMFQALRDSVAAHPGKMGWANVETFILPPHGVDNVDATSLYEPGNINRISQQIDAAAPYVPKIVTWIYQHTMLSNSLYDNVGSWTEQYTPARANARRALRQAYMSRYGGAISQNTNQDNNTQNNPTPSHFSDVPTTHPLYSYIEKLRVNGIIGGCTSSTFCPSAALTRAEAAVVLLRAKHGASYVPPSSAATFSDASTHWAKDWIEALKNSGIAGGCGGSNYCPDQGVTRAEMAVMLLRTRNGASYAPPDATSAFADARGHWAEDWIEALRTNSITSGCGGGNYCPDVALSRSESAVFIVNAFPSLGAPTPSPTNGVCASTHYNCRAGSRGDYQEYASEWQWWCNGSAGGTNILCSEPKPTQAPTNTPRPSVAPSQRPTATPRATTNPTATPTSTPITFKPGDLNKDKHVNRLDYLLFLDNFGKQYTLFDYNSIVTNYER